MGLSRKFMKITLLIVMFLSFFAFAEHALSSHKDTYFVDEMVYHINDPSLISNLESTYNITLIDHRISGLATFKISESTDVDTLLSMGFAYNQTSHVTRPPFASTKDPYIDNQYALPMMQTIDAWQLTTGSAWVKVAIIDTGIDITHDEFSNRISPESYNAYTQAIGITEVIDDHGHGTMVAGIIGANKDNSKGIAGIAQNIELLVIKANRPNEGVFSDNALIDAIYYATNQEADVINLSLGGTYLNVQTEQAIAYARAQGVIVIAASGNDGTDELIYPAAFEETLAVSAIDSKKIIAEYSNFGSHIDLSAPGSDIITTALNNGYATVSGTSFAAPQVTGVVALMLSYFDAMSADEIITRLLLTSEDLGSLGKDFYYGHGMVNTYQALTQAFVKVSFDTQSTEMIDPLWIPQNTSPELPIPIREDHVFEGWFFDASFQRPYISSETILLEDVLLYAKFNASFHNVYFITLGTQVLDLVVAHGKSFDLPQTSLEGYQFIGWTTDVSNLNAYVSGPVTSDLTLYAHFEPIIYYEVTRMDNDTVIDQLSFEKDTLIDFEPIEKVGHTFVGWFYDPDGISPFEPLEIINDLTIYAVYDINQYTISFDLLDGGIKETIVVNYNDILTLPIPKRENLTFIDWYIDDQFRTVYVLEPVTEEFTLYAKFVPQAYQVSYYIGSILYAQKMVEANASFEVIIPTRIGYEFIDWMLDQALTIPYVSVPITEDLELYAQFHEKNYVVRFYDDYDILFLEVLVDAYGSLDLPEGPIKQPSKHFTYTFIGWDQRVDEISSDLNIYPIYERHFIRKSVELNPGIDTIYQGNIWVNTGITLTDDSVDVVITDTIDLSTPGRYQVIYTLYDQDVVIDKLIRFVRVVFKIPTIDMILNPGIDTIYVGGTHVDQGVSYEGDYTLNVISNLDTTQSGTYQILYLIEHNGYTYQKTRVVHVIKDVILIQSFNRIPYIQRKDDDDEI